MRKWLLFSINTYGKVIRYEYDAVGNITKVTYPDNTAVTYAYDANRNLIRVTDWNNRVTSYTYDVNNRVTGVTKPDGSVIETVYDNMQRVTSTVERTAGGTVITGFEYTYDDMSRIVEEKNLANGAEICYTYDSLGRVTSRAIDAGVEDECGNEVVVTENYSYDAAGNLTSAPDTTFAYGTNNRLTQFNGNSVSYDLDGNMLNNGVMTCTYDSANRLLTAGGHTYTYNAEDVRIRNLCTGNDTTYTYDTNCRLSRLLTKTTNGVTTKYVYGRGLIGEETSGSFKTYHFDCRGSTVAITNANGNITDTFAYDTYGKCISRTGTSTVIFGYNGRDGVVTDANGLIYMRARYYSPDMRRFVNADIVAGEISNAITLNRFAYANGNPVSFVDPFGLAAENEHVPSALVAAYLAQHIYDVDDYDFNVICRGWLLEDLYTNEQSLRIGIYSKTSNGVISYAIVNMGTKNWDLDDYYIYNNLLQPLGLSNDMKDSIEFAIDFVNSHPDSNITFIGHSKGGAEAIANAVATNKNAIVFNPATAFLDKYDLPVDEYSGTITSYVVNGEVLDSISVILGKNIGVEESLESAYDYYESQLQWDYRLGAQEPTAQLGQFLGNMLFNVINSLIEKHDIELVIKILEKKYSMN